MGYNILGVLKRGCFGGTAEVGGGGWGKVLFPFEDEGSVHSAEEAADD